MPKKNLNSVTGQRIRVLRRMLGLSQSDLATRMGLSPQQIQKYEAGQSNISLNALENISRTLNTSPSDMLGMADTSAAKEIETGTLQTRTEYREKRRHLDQEIIEAIAAIQDKKVRKNLLELLLAVEQAEPVSAEG